jgi:hypothetical protein
VTARERIAQLKAERDQARTIAVALEGEVAVLSSLLGGVLEGDV